MICFTIELKTYRLPIKRLHCDNNEKH